MNQHNYREILSKLVSFNTVSDQSNLELIDYLCELFDQPNCVIERYYNDMETKANLIIRLGPETDGGIIFSGHTDVVPVTDQPWETNPFELTQQDNKLVGRGTADMKGFIALVCDTVLHLDLDKLKHPIYLVFTYDEEIGCLGAQSIRSKLAELAPYVQFALIGEPTNFELVNAHKGILVYKSEFHGKPAHSSCPHLGASAILAAAEFIQTFPTHLPQDEDSRFNPAYTTFNAGTINGGNAINIIAEHCQLHWECRPIPSVANSAIEAHVEALSETIHGSNQVDMTHHVMASVPGLTPEGSEQALIMLQSFLPDHHAPVTTAPYVTEGGIFQNAGIPSVIFGPGNIEQAHQPHESVSVESMEQYRYFLMNLVNHFVKE